METRVAKLETKVSEMDKNLGIFSEIIKRFDGTILKLSTSLDKFDVAIGDFKIGMMELKNDVECNVKDISQLQTKVTAIDDSAKFNWLNFVNNKLIPFLIGGGAIWAIIEIVNK